MDDENAEKHTVTMVKEAGQALGFSIRGGSEHGLGIYVSEIDEGSPAGQYNYAFYTYNLCIVIVLFTMFVTHLWHYSDDVL